MKTVIIRRKLEIYKFVDIPDELYNSIMLDETGDVMNDDVIAPNPGSNYAKDDWILEDEDVEVDTQPELNGEPDPTKVL